MSRDNDVCGPALRGKETMLAIESLHVCDEFDSGSSGCRNDMLETKPSTIKRK